MGEDSPVAGRTRILFVCLGNICRSPAAEAVMRHHAIELGVQDRFEFDSAGTSSYHIGEPADRRMRLAAQRRGIEITSLARMVSLRDFENFDLILAMDRNNFQELSRLRPHSNRLGMLSDYLDHSWPRDVPDPYYGADDGFETVLDMLQAASPNLISHFPV